ncbi:hypothetical protein RJ639_001775 [Escallonia herrerae]|uniref:non-specific serine/threonine protein kinase n=1 Tax=Escallonia herrerae TaxID=1293975 RepID=A0AA89BI83_9ASTE|nr:hypothetical protein RJ639_001775 [Escallonia herrerae]
MGHCCSKDASVSVIKDTTTTNNNNNHHPKPSPPPPTNGTTPVDSRSSKNTPAHSFSASPSQSPYPAGVDPSPARTPKRMFKWPFPPPSPAKPIMSAIMKRQGTAAAPVEGPIPEEEGGVEQLDKSFGYSKNFIAKYELGKEVGRGHFGHTCWARGKKGELKNQPVAVKIISKAKMTTAISIEDVRREVKILRALSGHKNLVKFYDAFEDAHNVYVVMEYTVRRWRIARPNIVKNFLFTTRDEAAPMKLIDFGLSDFIRPDQRLNDIVGSAYYVSPEVLRRSYSVEADIWSIGVITYILLCGSRPFWARTESGIFRSVLRADPNFDDSPWPAVSVEAKDFVRRLLNKDHRKRMTAAQALTHPWLRDEKCAVPLDILIYKLVKSYVRTSPLKRYALKALSKALPENELIYLKGQFNLLEPQAGFVSLQNFRTILVTPFAIEALMKYATDAMMEARVPDILKLMEFLSYKKMEFEEFCAAAVNPYQLEALEGWESIATTAFEHFEREGNRVTSVEELAQEMNLGHTAHTLLNDWIRESDGKLNFLGYTKFLHGVTIRSSNTRQI